MSRGLIYVGRDTGLLRELRQGLGSAVRLVHRESVAALREQLETSVHQGVLVHLNRLTLGVLSPQQFVDELVAAVDIVPVLGLADKDCPPQLRELTAESISDCLPVPVDFQKLHSAMSAAEVSRRARGLTLSTGGSASVGIRPDQTQGKPFGASIAETASTNLLVQIKTGDTDAWQRLVRLYTPLIYRLCRRCSLQPEDAEDVTQEVFRSVSRSVGGFRRGPRRGSFRGWLWTIAHNKIRDHIRSAAHRPGAVGGSQIQRCLLEVPELLDDESSAQPTEEDEYHLLHAALNLIRDEFESQTWTAFWRVTVEGHSTTDIADDLQMTKPAIRQAKYRVLRRLRQEVGNVD